MVQSIVPLGFALMALRFALRMLEALAQLRKAHS
jgi:TRAP-type C4-dicarboxylate transport system permease small subunit